MPRGRTSRPRRRSHMPRFRPRAVREARRAARARACAGRSEAALSTAPGPRVGERLRATRRQQPAKRPGLRRYRFVSIRVRTIRRRACAAFLSSRLLASFGQAWPHYLAPVIVKLEMQRSVRGVRAPRCRSTRIRVGAAGRRWRLSGRSPPHYPELLYPPDDHSS